MPSSVQHALVSTGPGPVSSIDPGPVRSQSRDGTTGVVLLNMGGPDSLEAVEPFLYNLFSDNDIIPLPLRGFLLQPLLAKIISSRRSRFVREYYGKIGNRSPIARITRLQAARLEQRLNQASPVLDDGSPAFRCYVAMRYWKPTADEAVAAMVKDGVKRIVALTLYPHYTTATTLSSMKDLKRALAKSPLADVPVLEIDRYPDEPAYLDAMTRRVQVGLRRFPAEVRGQVKLLFSAHGLPMSFIAKGDPYVSHLHATITGVIARLSRDGGEIPEWLLSYQSRAGPTRWLEPATDDTLRELATSGHRHVLAIPVAFVSDHIETLYEMDMLFGDEARAMGLVYKRAPALNGEPLYTEALANLVERRLSAASGSKALLPAHSPPLSPPHAKTSAGHAA